MERRGGWKGGREAGCELPPRLAAGTGVSGARLCRFAAGSGVRAAFGCGKYGVGCHRAANPAIWAAVSGDAADKTRWGAGHLREDGKLPQTNAANPAKREVGGDQAAREHDRGLLMDFEILL